MAAGSYTHDTIQVTEIIQYLLSGMLHYNFQGVYNLVDYTVTLQPMEFSSSDFYQDTFDRKDISEPPQCSHKNLFPSYHPQNMITASHSSHVGQ